MYLCPSTHSALHVFRADPHPSVFKAETKEGLSLFALLNRTRTAAGAARLREWLRVPSRALPTVLARHDAVAFFASPTHGDLAADVARTLAGAGSVAVRPGTPDT